MSEPSDESTGDLTASASAFSGCPVSSTCFHIFGIARRVPIHYSRAFVLVRAFYLAAIYSLSFQTGTPRRAYEPPAALPHPPPRFQKCPRIGWVLESVAQELQNVF